MVARPSLHLDWLAVDGPGTAARLAAAVGAVVKPGERLILRGGSLAVVDAPDAAGDRLGGLRIEAGRPSGAGGSSEPVPGTLLGVGWATVELDRAEAELAELVGRTAGRKPAVGLLGDDPSLGARVRALWLAPAGPAIVLLEPSTEGRLAASLARHGEGPAAIYVARPGAAPASGWNRPGDAGVTVGRQVIGPFGPQVLVGGGRPWDPHLIVAVGPRMSWRRDSEPADLASALGHRIERGAGTIDP